MSFDYTSAEMMTVTAARALENDMTCFVGIGLPSEAAYLARLTHAPDVVLINIGKGPTRVITDLCVMKPDLESKELVVVSLHPDITREDVVETTGWEARFAEPLESTAEPSEKELEILRDLKERPAHAYSGQ